MLRLSALLSSLLLLATLSIADSSVTSSTTVLEPRDELATSPTHTNHARDETTHSIHAREEITTSPTKEIHARDTIVSTLARREETDPAAPGPTHARRDDCSGSECTMTVSV